MCVCVCLPLVQKYIICKKNKKQKDQSVLKCLCKQNSNRTEGKCDKGNLMIHIETNRERVKMLLTSIGYFVGPPASSSGRDWAVPTPGGTQDTAEHRADTPFDH